MTGLRIGLQTPGGGPIKSPTIEPRGFCVPPSAHRTAARTGGKLRMAEIAAAARGAAGGNQRRGNRECRTI